MLGRYSLGVPAGLECAFDWNWTRRSFDERVYWERVASGATRRGLAVGGLWSWRRSRRVLLWYGCVSGAGKTYAYVSWPGVLDDGQLGGTASWRSRWSGAPGPAVERRSRARHHGFGRPRGRPRRCSDVNIQTASPRERRRRRVGGLGAGESRGPALVTKTRGNGADDAIERRACGARRAPRAPRLRDD